MGKQSLDYALVPLGLLVLVAYHIWLVRRVRKQPTTTVMGVNAINRRLWVHSMMQDQVKTGVLAVQSLRNNIMASTLMASTAIMLCSLIALLMTNGGGWPSRLEGGRAKMVVGDVSELGLTIKFFAILACFLLAFLFEVQSVRYYSHSTILINVPLAAAKGAGAGGPPTPPGTSGQLITPEYVAETINRGSYFWSLGLRAFYFSFPLFLWIFGPIPMFVCCALLVLLLYFLDVSSVGGAASLGGEEDPAAAGCAQC
uniref:tRNA(Met) cytidine acetyltransferase TmcA n=1 Tax=Anthurium amnicola TaxID=1678845 RepID=A0A1D1YHQ9_9ARAE